MVKPKWKEDQYNVQTIIESNYSIWKEDIGLVSLS